jgi:hypothetical protein
MGIKQQSFTHCKEDAFLFYIQFYYLTSNFYTFFFAKSASLWVIGGYKAFCYFILKRVPNSDILHICKAYLTPEIVK